MKLDAVLPYGGEMVKPRQVAGAVCVVMFALWVTGGNAVAQTSHTTDASIVRTQGGCIDLTTVPVDSATASRMHPDVVIHASATAQSVTVNGQPHVNVKFNGCGIRDTVMVLERTNLPKPVVSGATYTNVRIAVELLAYFDVDCIVAQLNAPADSAGRAARTCRRKQ